MKLFKITTMNDRRKKAYYMAAMNLNEAGEKFFAKMGLTVLAVELIGEGEEGIFKGFI